MSKDSPVRIEKINETFYLEVRYPKKSNKLPAKLKFKSFDPLWYWLEQEKKYIFDNEYEDVPIEDLDFEDGNTRRIKNE